MGTTLAIVSPFITGLPAVHGWYFFQLMSSGIFDLVLLFAFFLCALEVRLLVPVCVVVLVALLGLPLCPQCRDCAIYGLVSALPEGIMMPPRPPRLDLCYGEVDELEIVPQWVLGFQNLT